ncbi:MAG: hypothetical protein MUC50_17330 [Myxococcota bacterium]|nr:hypothetical protein [Myxococcota bacterium]
MTFDKEIKQLASRTTAPSALCAILSLGFLLSIAGSAQAAQVCPPGMPCQYAVAESKFEKVPAVFKFQSRVSQGKIPLGDVTFDKIIVNVKSGSATVCSETFSKVRVLDSVLNLEIGRNMTNCDLDSVIAKTTGLKFQVCLGVLHQRGGAVSLRPPRDRGPRSVCHAADRQWLLRFPHPGAVLL